MKREKRQMAKRNWRHLKGSSEGGGTGKAAKNGNANISEPNQKGTQRRKRKEEGCGNEDKMRGRQPAEDRRTHQSPESHQSKQLSLGIRSHRAAVNELISGKRSNADCMMEA